MTKAARLTPAARRDLAEIYDYTVERWGRLQAERYVIRLRDACDGLAEGEIRGRSAGDVRPGYLKYAVGSHVVFYRIAEGVVVIRILHSRMDVSSRL